ncbi:hypothetical protein AGMMS50239_36580 [Bacteroidia bacterium]|nr:hypothetical protein AGMMS50239_36580 [Bacteroidia bacterium]
MQNWEEPAGCKTKASASTWSKYGNKRTYSPFFYSVDAYDQITGKYRLMGLNPTEGSSALGEVAADRNTSEKYYFEGRLNWNRQFDKHSVGAMTVMMVQENLFSTKGGSIFEALPERNVGNSGRLTYDFDERYFVEFGYGYNGSKKFTGSKQFSKIQYWLGVGFAEKFTLETECGRFQR